MARQFSKSQIDKLGERLRRSDSPNDDDLRTLQSVRAEYGAPMSEVESVLRGLGLSATSRLKTINTIVEKLKREKNRLSTIQDIAGLRIVEDCTLFGQDEIVAEIEPVLDDVKVHDRRTNPSHGYRAVHLVAAVRGFPVEIQVRTVLQDQWAQLFEALADTWGRQIRYGGPPNLPNENIGGRLTRRDLVEDLKGLISQTVARSEYLTNLIAEVESPPGWRVIERVRLWRVRRASQSAENDLMQIMSSLMEPIQREIHR